MSPLARYVAKRRFTRTPEPRGRVSRGKAAGRAFVVQKHRATVLHYDFRLEGAGVTRSWAVPKGPSLDPSVKRLAMQVEDHPLDHVTFEGVIPEGEYGGGTVMVWDIGTWVPDDEGDPERSFRAGRIRFTLRAASSRAAGTWCARAGGSGC